jgi:hypothetical protein
MKHYLNRSETKPGRVLSKTEREPLLKIQDPQMPADSALAADDLDRPGE